MTRSLDAANRAISTVTQMAYGAAHVEAAEQQVRLVETEGPLEAKAFALWALVDAYYWSQEVDRAFVAFTQLLRWWDRRPELFDDTDRSSLFWSFKWMVSSLADFPEVPAEQIDRTLADMEHRYRLLGEGMDAVVLQRFEWARARGADDAEEAFAAWSRSPRDEYSDCEACGPRTKAEWFIETGRREEGVRLIEATLLEERRCGTEPASMLTTLAEAYLDLGRAQDCVRTYRRALAEIPRAQGALTESRGALVRLLAKGGQPDRALAALVEDQHLLLAAESPGVRFAFLLGAGAATHLVRALDESRAVALTAVPVGTVAELDEWIHREALTLATAFDTRNGTTRYAERVREAWRTPASGIVLDLDVIPAARPHAGPRPEHGPTDEPRGGDGSAAGSAGSAPPVGAPLRSAAEVLHDAEQAVRADPLDAVPLYLEAARLFESAGLLVDAGFAWAEAAHTAQTLGDDTGAAATFATAIGRLRAGGAEPTQVVPVVVSWARSAAPARAVAPVLEVAEELGTTLAETSPRSTADLLDTRARLLATLGRHAEAAALAERAATAYTAAGATRDAAHASWLAGRLHLEHQEPGGQGGHADDPRTGTAERAQRCLESAVAGFRSAGARQDRGAAAGDLLALLRRTGQEARAEQLATELAQR